MKYIHQVSGDIPEAESFRSQFQNLTTYFSGLYTTRLQEAKDAAYAASQAQAQAKAKEAAAQSAALAAAQKTYDVAAAAPTEVMGNNPSASNGPHAYGVISASQSDSTLVGLLLAIASIL